jgi:hypothetical protein
VFAVDLAAKLAAAKIDCSQRTLMFEAQCSPGSEAASASVSKNSTGSRVGLRAPDLLFW